MSEGQYWNGDVTLTRVYKKKYEYEREEINQRLWLQGLYIYEAMANLSPIFRAFAKNPKPLPYPAKPYPLTVKDITDREDEKHQEAKEAQKAKLQAWMETVNAKMKERKNEQ